MPPVFRFSKPIRFGKRTKIGEVRGSSLYLHWSMFLIVAIVLAGVARSPGLTLLGLAAYWSVLLLHEVGHLVAAQRLGCQVFSIELYPIFGVTRFATPWSRLDHCIIAWAGVWAQLVVALPIVMWVAIFGYTRFEAVNMLFAILGFFSLFNAVVNLWPAAPLDGATAWGIFPALWERWRKRARNPRFRR